MNTEFGKSSDNVISCSKPSSAHSVNHVDRGVSILHYNARSLLPKLDELNMVCEATFVLLKHCWMIECQTVNYLWTIISYSDLTATGMVVVLISMCVIFFLVIL